VHVDPACVGSREWSDHFGFSIYSIFLHFCKRLFPRLELMTSWSQGNSFTAAPGTKTSIKFSRAKSTVGFPPVLGGEEI
jgi:hypothetical protein